MIVHGDSHIGHAIRGEWDADGVHKLRTETHRLLAEDGETIRSHVVGQRITAFAWENPEGECPPGNDIYVGLEDGTVLRFAGWGHDAWGTEAQLYEPEHGSSGQ